MVLMRFKRKWKLSMNRRRSVGVPPASSPSVSLDEGPGGETPPELAAGTAALRHVGSRPDARPMLEVEALHERRLPNKISMLYWFFY